MYLEGEDTRGRVEACDIGESVNSGVYAEEADAAVIDTKFHDCQFSGVQFYGYVTNGRLERNTFWSNGRCGILLEGRANPEISRNVIRDHYPENGDGGYGIEVGEGRPFRNLRISADNVFERNAGGDFGGEGGKAAQMGYEDERSMPAIAAWWAAQHAARAAAHAAGAPDDWILAPPPLPAPARDDYDYDQYRRTVKYKEVKPGESVQEAVDQCVRGGSVVLLPGVHEGPLLLQYRTEVHVFGRGRAILRASGEHVVVSHAKSATLDGLILRREWDNSADDCDEYSRNDSCVAACGDKLRIQVCDAERDRPCSVVLSCSKVAPPSKYHPCL